MSLTGFWVGRYWYFAPFQPVVRFIANLNDDAGRLTGSISEADLYTPSEARLEAFIMGSHEGAVVKFAKVYDGAGPLAHRVDYTGTVSDDGRMIKGSWALPNEWGGFEMSRQSVGSEDEQLDSEKLSELEIIRL